MSTMPTLGMISGIKGRLSPPSLWVVPLFMPPAAGREWLPVEDAYVADIVPFHCIQRTDDMSTGMQRLLRAEEHRRLELRERRGYTLVWITATRFGAEMRGGKPKEASVETRRARQQQTFAVLYGEEHPANSPGRFWGRRTRLEADAYTGLPEYRNNYEDSTAATELVQLQVVDARP